MDPWKDNRPQVELDVGAALNAVEAAAFEVDDLWLNVIKRGLELPPEVRVLAYQEAGTMLHYAYQTLRMTIKAFDRHVHWPDLEHQGAYLLDAQQSDKVTLARGELWAAREELMEAKANIEKCAATWVLGAEGDPAHWCQPVRAQYSRTFDWVSKAISKLHAAIECIDRGHKLLDILEGPKTLPS